MKRMRSSALPTYCWCFVVFCLLLTACQSGNDTSLLYGKWEGALLTEEGDSVMVNPAEIKFEFQPDGRYSYASTLNYKEAGTFRLQQVYLYTTDTTGSAPDEKAVEIELLTNDSLVMRMIREEQEQRLTLIRPVD